MSIVAVEITVVSGERVAFSFVMSFAGLPLSMQIFSDYMLKMSLRLMLDLSLSLSSAPPPPTPTPPFFSSHVCVCVCSMCT